MKKWLTAIFTLTLALAMLAPTAGCGKAGVGEGNLPVLQTGDKWVYSSSIGSGDSATTDIIFEVTGEDIVNGADCYVFTMSNGVYPDEISFLNRTYYNKANLWLVGTQTLRSDGYLADTMETTLLEFTDGFPWPLKTGKEFKVSEASTSITAPVAAGETSTSHSNKTSTWKVEKVEDISVPAGTFRCFKINIYNENSIVQTRWYSDEVKFFVKFSVVYPYEATIAELKSFQTNED